MTRTLKQEIQNVQWLDVGLHVGISVVTLLIAWSLFGNIGIAGSFGATVVWPVRELYQSRTWYPQSWSLKKYLEAFAPVAVSVPVAWVLWT